MAVEWRRHGSGRAVCIVHPYSSMFEAVEVVAEVTGHPVVAVDPRGVSRSSPPEPPHAYGFEEIVDDLEAVRRALSLDSWVVWGMSGGSMVAQAYARVHPAGLAAAIFDSAGACFRETLADPACIVNPRHPAWAELGLVAAAPDEPPLEWKAADAVWVWRTAGGRAAAVSPTKPDEPMRRMMPFVWAHDARPWLAEIRLPVLVLAGSEDAVAPVAQIRALHAALPAAELAIIEGAGHVPVGTHPDAVRESVRRFIQKVGA